jgi:hypothetical protein
MRNLFTDRWSLITNHLPSTAGGVGRGRGVGRSLGVGVGRGVTIGVGVTVAVGVGVGSDSVVPRMVPL